MTEEQEAEIMRLREIREGMGYSQEKFSDALGISMSAYGKIESLKRPLTLAHLKKLYHTFNISSDYILFGDRTDGEAVWASVINCSERDKMRLYMRLAKYFTFDKPGIFPRSDDGGMDFDRLVDAAAGDSK